MLEWATTASGFLPPSNSCCKAVGFTYRINHLDVEWSRPYNS